MSPIKSLIEYLRLRRRYEENEKKPPVIQTEVSLQLVEERRTSYTVSYSEFVTDTRKFQRIYALINANVSKTMYVWETPQDRIYLLKNSAGEYRRIPDSLVVVPRETELTAYSLDASAYNYIYDAEKNRVVISVQEMERITVFSDSLSYGPNEEYLRDVKEGVLIYEYNKPITGFAEIMEDLFEHYTLTWEKGKVVSVRKSPKSGFISLIPILDIDINHQVFTLRYPFTKKGFQPTFSLPDEDCGIILKFQKLGAILSFLNETLFSQGFDEFVQTTGGRALFQEQFRQQVIRLLENRITSDIKKYYGDALEILYYLPVSIAKDLDSRVLWALIAEGIRSARNISDTILEKKQSIYVKLIGIILEKDNEDEKFIEYLAKRIDTILLSDNPFNISSSGPLGMSAIAGFAPPKKIKITILEYLYTCLSGKNLIAFAYLVNKAWRRTRFVDPNPRTNKEYIYTTGPKFLPYESKKVFGFFSSNVSAHFVENPRNQKESILQLSVDKKTKLPGILTSPLNLLLKDDYYYHPFFPIKIVNVGKESKELETAIQLDVIVPAFMIKLNRDEQFWHNVMKAVEYAVDIAVIIASYGTLSELVAAEALTSLAFLRGAGAISALSGSTVNLVLKLANAEDSPLGRTLSEYLFWVELLSLSGELTLVIRNGLRKSAYKLIATEEDALKLRNQLDDAVIEENGVRRKLTQSEKDEVLEELIAQGKYSIDNLIERAARSGKTIGSISLKIIIRDIHNVTETATAVARLLKKGKIKLVILDEADFFNTARTLGYKPDEIANLAACQYRKKIYLRSNSTLDVAFGEIVHEGKHALDWLEGLHKNPSLLRERTKAIVHDNVSMERYVNKMNDLQVSELRARIAEREFQLAAKQVPDFASVKEMVNFIMKNYKN